MKPLVLGIMAATVSSSAVVARADSTPEAVEGALVYEPQALWSQSSAGEGCSVRRDFARADQRMTFVMQRMDHEADIQFGLFGDGIARQRGTLHAGFMPSAGLGRFKRIADASIGEMPGLVFSGQPFPTPATGNDESGDRPRSSSALADAVGDTEFFVADGVAVRPLALHTYAIDKALQALDDCLSEKLAALGVPQAVLDRTETSARPVDIDQWAAEIQKNYPAEALRSRYDGPVPVRLVIDPQGRPTHCHVLNQMTAKVLREAACSALLQYGRFEPARDAEGEPLPGLLRTSIQYELKNWPPVDAHGMKVYE